MSIVRGSAFVLGAAAAVAVGLGWAPPAGATPREEVGRGPDARLVRLKAVSFDPLRAVPSPLGLPPRQAYAPGVRGAYLVQFEGPIGAAERVALEEAGASVKGYVPMMTLEVVMTERERPAVEAIPGVRWVGPLQDGFKLAPELWSELRAPADAARRLRLQVALFPGEGEGALAALSAIGGRVRRVERGRSFALAELELPGPALRSLLRLPLVRTVERIHERRLHNDRSRFHTGLTAVADDTFSAGLDVSLDGRDEPSGFQVKYGHVDGGLASAHPDFQTGLANGWITYYPGADDQDTGGNGLFAGGGHGTHTAGSVIGDGGQWAGVPEVPPGSGAVSQRRWRGVQPEAALHHISFDNELTDRETFEAQAEAGVHISTNSWGYVDCLVPSICISVADYNTNAALYDEAVWDADDDAPGQQPLIVLFSAGNDGDGDSDGCGSTGADQVGSPGTAKNVITVGANETDRGCGPDGDHVGDMTTFSSRGPVDPDATGQGLFKPDVTNVGGLWVLSTEAEGSGGSGVDESNSHKADFCSDTGPDYRYEAGTSMSCPLTAGLAGVVLQDLVVNRGVSSPSPSLVKALLVHGARTLAPSGACAYGLETDAASVHQGWGMVNALDTLYGPSGTPSQRNVSFENEISADAVATGETFQRTVQVPVGVPFEVTLAWTDAPASPAAGSPLVVNDLDLEVTGPEGTFLGNDFVGEQSAPSSAGGVPDRYNVVERVALPSVPGGSYTLTVRGFQVSLDQEPEKSGVNQDFSLVWSAPSVPACEDGLDNDGDGLTDLAGGDPGCDAPEDGSERSPLLPCDDGEDNDGDGRVDFVADLDGDGISDAPGDPGCRDPSWGLEDPQCQDGEDNDAQTGIDFDGGQVVHGACTGEPGGCPAGVSDPEDDGIANPDPQCVGAPWRDRERKRSCGLGFESGLLLVLLGALRSGRRRSHR